MLSQNVSPEAAEWTEKVILRRCSTRSFTDERVDRVVLEKLLRAGIHAPSGSNWQNQRFLVIDDREELLRIGRTRFVWPYPGRNRQRIRKRHPGGIIGHASAAIIVFADSMENDRRDNGEYYIWESLEIQNCAASIENILLMATALGLGSCWISASDKMNGTRLFSKRSWHGLLSNYAIPDSHKIQGIVILGYSRRNDEEGFPLGESKHGATEWRSTSRMPTDYYLIRERDPNMVNQKRVSRMDRSVVWIATKLRAIGHLILTFADKVLFRIEVKRYGSDQTRQRS